MNKKTTYEALIADKVNQLPVPDMADAIWAAIKLELDASPGTDEGDQQAPSQSLPANTMTAAAKLWLIIIAVAVAVLIILFIKNKNSDPVDSNKIPATIQENGKNPEPDSVTTTIKNITGTSTAVPFQPVQQKRIDALAPVLNPVFNDSIFTEPLKNPRNDSAILINNPPVIIKPDSSATILPPSKKPRGVKGIEDSDYKIISGKKDSLKN